MMSTQIDTQPRAAVERTRVVHWSDPVALAEALRRMSGLEAMQAMIRGAYPPPPIAQLMGFRLVEVGDGLAIFEGEPAEYLYNPIAVVHGGFAATLCDSAMGCSIHTKLAAGVAYTTTDVQVRFLRPLTAETGTVRCEGRAVNVGRRFATAECRLLDARGRLMATGTTACAIIGPT